MGRLPFILFLLPGLIVYIDFVKYAGTRKRLFPPVLSRIIDLFVIIVYPIVFLVAIDSGTEIDCCSDSPVFAPAHRFTLYCWIALPVLGFFISTFRKSVFPPIVESLVNCLILMGFLLNLIIAIHLHTEPGYWVFGNLPIALLFLIVLMENHQRILSVVYISQAQPESGITGFFWRILNEKVLTKYSILLLLGIPIFIFGTLTLLLFGQKPDSLIQAFTQTYYQGFSQLDHLCENVKCGGHYLCSVAANGHPNVVKPHRYGIRKGQLIMCNRQLLVSNAFEELIAEKNPRLHKVIRKNYDKVGAKIHRHYHLFENKWVSDMVYVLMKPLEWMFVCILYTVDTKPENRISFQYLPTADKLKIKKCLP